MRTFMMMMMTTTMMMMMKQLMRMKLGISARLNLLQTIMHLMVIHLLWHSGPLYCWPPLMRWILHWLPTSLCRWSSYQTLSKIDPYYGGRWHQRFFCCIQFPPASLWGGGQPPVLGKAQLTRHPVDLLSLSIRTGNDWFELAWQKSQLFIVAMVIFSFKLSWQWPIF